MYTFIVNVYYAKDNITTKKILNILTQYVYVWSTISGSFMVLLKSVCTFYLDFLGYAPSPGWKKEAWQQIKCTWVKFSFQYLHTCLILKLCPCIYVYVCIYMVDL